MVFEVVFLQFLSVLILIDSMNPFFPFLNPFFLVTCSNIFLFKSLDFDYIFVDEVSMLGEVFYKFLMVIKKIKSNIKFFISGDYNQLKNILYRKLPRFTRKLPNCTTKLPNSKIRAGMFYVCSGPK